eukprot:3554791-Rhodomonas_salina.2
MVPVLHLPPTTRQEGQHNPVQEFHRPAKGCTKANATECRSDSTRIASRSSRLRGARTQTTCRNTFESAKRSVAR